MVHEHGKSASAVVAGKPDEQGRSTGCGAGGSEGRRPRGMRTSKTRAGHRTGKACQLRWTAYDKSQGKGRRNGSTSLFHHISRRLPPAWRSLRSSETRRPA